MFTSIWPNSRLQMVKQYIWYSNGRRTYHKSLKRSIKIIWGPESTGCDCTRTRLCRLK